MAIGTCGACGGAAREVTPFGQGLCFDVDKNGERVIGTGCYGALEASEAARIDALATALGCKREEVNADTLAVAASIAKCEWYDVTPQKLTGKLTAVRAAVAAEVAGE